MKRDFQVMQNLVAEPKSESPFQEMPVTVVSKINSRFLHTTFNKVNYVRL